MSVSVGCKWIVRYLRLVLRPKGSAEGADDLLFRQRGCEDDSRRHHVQDGGLVGEAVGPAYLIGC